MWGSVIEIQNFPEKKFDTPEKTEKQLSKEVKHYEKKVWNVKFYIIFSRQTKNKKGINLGMTISELSKQRKGKTLA